MVMDCQNSCTSPLSRIWVIETLACSCGVDISLLLDFLEKAPKISTDLGRNARELVSFRILESFFIQGSRANLAYCGSSEKIRLDPNDCCEDVLVEILTQTSISHLKPFGPEVLKWDLWPFIENKRSSLTKCALQKLKDEILTGSHSSFASLREQSGFPVGNQADHDALVDYAKCNGITSRPEGSNSKDNHLLPRDVPDENLAPVNRKRGAASESAGGMLSKNDCEPHEESVKKYKHNTVGSVGRNLPTKDDNEPTSSMGFVGPDEDLSHVKRVPHCDTELNKESEGRRQNHDTEEAEGDKEGFCAHNITREDMDKFEQNVQRNYMSIDEVQEDISGDSDGNDDDMIDIAGKSNAQYAHSGDYLAETNRRDQNPLADTSKRYSEEERCSLRYSEEERCSLGKVHIKVTGQNQPPGNGNNTCTSSKEHVCHDEVLPREQQAPHCETEVLNNKFDGEKRQDRDGDDAEDGRKDIHCLRTTENVNSFVQNDIRNVASVGEAEEGVDSSSDSDEYYDEVNEFRTKKKSLLSSQRTYSQDSLTTLKLCVKCNKSGKLLVCCSNSCLVVIHESCLGSDASFDTRGIFYCPFCAYSRAISNYTRIKRKASMARKDLATFMCLETQQEPKQQPHRSCEEKQNHLEQVDSLRKGNDQIRRDDVVSKHRRRKKLEFDPSMLSELHSGHSPPFGGESVTNRLVHTLNKDKQERRTRHSSYEVQGTSGGNETHADIRHKKGVPCPPETDLPDQGKCSRSSDLSDADETSVDSGVSKYFLRVQKQVSYPAIPQFRRKRLMWASAEEDKIKEGMRKFCSPHDKVIPWAKILEHGAGVFHHSRTTIDLKDKWRNMCKSTPKPK